MIPYRPTPDAPWTLRDPATGELASSLEGAVLTFDTRAAALAYTAAAPAPAPAPVVTPPVDRREIPPTAAASGVGNDPSSDTAAIAATEPATVPRPAAEQAAEISREIALEPARGEMEILRLTDRQAAVAETVRTARSKNTLLAYATAWRAYAGWCERERRDPYSGPATIAEYLRDLVDGAVPGRRAASVQTVNGAVSAISAAYADHGCAAPKDDAGLRLFLRGLRREIGMAPKRQSAPVTDVELRAVLSRISGDDILSLRDRALLLVGWAGCMRRSEITGLRVEDVTEEHAGLVIRLRNSKTDQEGRGAVKVIPRSRSKAFCPVTALQAWLTAAGIRDGYVFRGIDAATKRPLETRMSGWSVALVVKSRVTAAGLDPKLFSGHSLRAGFLTAAARAGASERSMMNQSGHRRTETLRGYIRAATVWDDNAATVAVDLLGKT